MRLSVAAAFALIFPLFLLDHLEEHRVRFDELVDSLLDVRGSAFDPAAKDGP